MKKFKPQVVVAENHNTWHLDPKSKGTCMTQMIASLQKDGQTIVGSSLQIKVQL